MARAARAAGVPVYTVALGTADGAVMAPDGAALPVPPDPAALAEVARITGGKAFAAEDADALDEVYERLGSRIGTRREKREISAGFAAAGLLLLAGALGTSLRWRGRLPERRVGSQAAAFSGAARRRSWRTTSTPSVTASASPSPSARPLRGSPSNASPPR